MSTGQTKGATSVSASSRARAMLGTKLSRLADAVAPAALSEPEAFLRAHGWSPMVDAHGPAWSHATRGLWSTRAALRHQLTDIAGRTLALCGWSTGLPPVEPHWFCNQLRDPVVGSRIALVTAVTRQRARNAALFARALEQAGVRRG